MTGLPFETATINQLPEAVAISPDAMLPFSEPGAKANRIAFKRLLGKLIQTNTVKTTRALLNADLAFADASVALVYADTTPAYNGWYRKIGASGAGSWSQFEKLGSQALAEVQAIIAQAEAARDAAQGHANTANSSRVAAGTARDEAVAARDAITAALASSIGTEGAAVVAYIYGALASTGGAAMVKTSSGATVEARLRAGGTLLPLTDLADAAGQNAALISAALADPTVSTLILPAGDIYLSEPIVMQSGKTVKGMGQAATKIRLKPGFAYGSPNNGAICASQKSSFIISDMSIDNGKIGWTGSDFTTRLCGLRLLECTDFLVERMTVRNASGYSYWPTGTASLPSQLNLMSHRATFRDCWSYNANVHFEAMRSFDFLFDDCHARAGDDDIPCEGMFHPILFSSNIHFQNCTGSGKGSGLLIVSSQGPMANISMDNCRTISTYGYPLNIENNATPAWAISGIKLTNSHFETTNGEAINWPNGGPGAPILASNCTFKAKRLGGNVGGLSLVRSEGSRFSNCSVEVEGGFDGGSIYGVASDDPIAFDGSITLRPVAGCGATPVGSATTVRLSPTTFLSPQPQRHKAVMRHDAGQEIAGTVVSGASSIISITMAVECLNKDKAQFSLYLIDSVTPATPLSYSVYYENGTPFVVVRINGDFGGKRFGWRHEEYF